MFLFQHAFFHYVSSLWALLQSLDGTSRETTYRLPVPACDLCAACGIRRYLWYAQFEGWLCQNTDYVFVGHFKGLLTSSSSVELIKSCQAYTWMHQISVEQRRRTRTISLQIPINPALSEEARSFSTSYLGHGEREQDEQFDQNIHCTIRSPTIWRKIGQTAQAHQQPEDQLQREPRKRPRACSHFASDGTCRLTWRAIVFSHVEARGGAPSSYAYVWVCIYVDSICYLLCRASGFAE